MPAPSSPYYRLRIKSLKFISAVDAGAQGPIANVALIKRAVGGSDVDATCRVIKVDEKLGLVFGWALASSLDGGATPHVDMQNDAIVGDDELIKIAAEFVEAGAASDVLHDESPDGKIVFCLPLTKDVNAALGIRSNVHGLAIAMRPSPATFKRFVSKELNAFSIGGLGERELVKFYRTGKDATAKPKCADCNAYMAADATKCAGCGMTKRAVTTRKAAWTSAEIDDLPDSSFLYVEDGGKTDTDGKTTPRSLRHFPYRDGANKIDLDHLRDAISRIPQSSLPKTLRDKLQVKAEKLLAAQHDKATKRVAKAAGGSTVLTDEVDGHQHSVDLDDPADGWSDQLSTSYQTADGATTGHSHAWTYDATTGAVTIASDSGHSHTITAVVSASVVAQAALNDTGERCRGCGEMCEDDCRYCPRCGARLGDDGVPQPVIDEKSSGAVLSIALRAGNSTPSRPVPTVKGNSQEPPPMTTLAAPDFRKMLSLALLLPETQRAHVAKLAPTEQEAFLVLDATARDGAMKAADAADPVVHTTKSGMQIRKSHGELPLQQAKQLDAQAEQLEKQATESAILKAANERAAIEKRAVELIPLIGKSLAVRVEIVKSVSAIADETLRNDVVEALKGANAAFQKLGVPQGTDGGGAEPVNKTPVKAWNDGLAAFAKSQNIANPLDATIPFLKTDDGKALRDALDALRPMAQPS